MNDAVSSAALSAKALRLIDAGVTLSRAVREFRHASTRGDICAADTYVISALPTALGDSRLEDDIESA